MLVKGVPICHIAEKACTPLQTLAKMRTPPE